MPHPLHTHIAASAPARAGQADRLSTTERAVVHGLARGRAPKQLAADGGVSLATIRAHIQNAKRKTRARTLAELVAITTRFGGTISH